MIIMDLLQKFSVAESSFSGFVSCFEICLIMQPSGSDMFKLGLLGLKRYFSCSKEVDTTINFTAKP